MAHDDSELVIERIQRDLVELVLPLADRAVQPFTIEAGPSLDELAPFSVGDRWGPPWTTTWFRFRGELPRGWDGPVEAEIDLGFTADMAGFQCEGLVRDGAGHAVQGIHPRRTRFALSAEQSAAPVELVVEAASNPMFPQFRPSLMGSPATAGVEPIYRVRRAELVLVDREAVELLHDLSVLDDMVRSLPPTDQRMSRVLRALERALDRIPDVAAARAEVAPALAIGARRGHHVVATGHAHIDTAWLWPIRETERKCVRTFSSAVRLMDDDPSFVFSCSSAQHYEWVRQCEPELFEKIRAKVASGQWAPVGGMWVEADMNLPSGESLVRQIVHGQRWFERELGVRCTEVWIPDVFGYPAGLPQVFAAGGMHRFVTQKLSWNRTNRFPHHTFWWEGLDGTRVLTHFPPVDDYNAEMWPRELNGSVERFRDHRWSDWSLVPYGHGDGGGGPTREMLARAHRMADLDGVPTVELGSVASFFDHVEAEIDAGADVPVWRGELYFETHRGTLTSQLGTKTANRRCERLLREAEAWAAAAGDTDSSVFDSWWQQVLTQQFHDIIPGSSIAWVHADAERILGRVGDEVETFVASTLRRLAPGGGVVANVATRDRDEVIVAEIEPGSVESCGADDVQTLDRSRVAFRANVASFGLSPLRAVRPDDRVVVTDRTMANRHVAVVWDRNGALTSIIDAERGREVLRRGEKATLELAVDRPVRYDAWDLESWVRRDPTVIDDAESVDVVASGPLVGEVRVTHRFGLSTAVVKYRMRAGSARVDVHVDLDWHHREHLLSWALPVDVRADTATFGVQFGAVRRPTHRSTSWDSAKFEVCAHRYSDVSEPGFGVAVLDDGRYGRCVFDGAIRVSLARGASYPDPRADEGRHTATLAVLPHGAGLADVVAEAERLDLPARVVAPTASGPLEPDLPSPLVRVSGSGVQVDAVKSADDGSGDLIVRLHEACGDRAAVTVAADRFIRQAAPCNLLEEPTGGFEVSDGVAAFTLAPFGLMTLRITRD